MMLPDSDLFRRWDSDDPLRGGTSFSGRGVVDARSAPPYSVADADVVLLLCPADFSHGRGDCRDSEAVETGVGSVDHVTAVEADLGVVSVLVDCDVAVYGV